MTLRLAAVGSILLWGGTHAAAHRLDEYLQATLISVEKDRIQAQIHLTPGVAVFPFVLASIDTDADGAISKPEQRAYAERVLRDLSLTIDGEHLRPRLVSTMFSDIEEMKQGRGEIQVEFVADLPDSSSKRTFILDNHHQARIAAYLVNCLVPRDPDIRITTQTRNYLQSLYRLDYEQVGVRSDVLPRWWWSAPFWVGAGTLLLLARFTMLWTQRACRLED